MTYEEMLQIAIDEGIQVIEYEFSGKIEGYYCDGIIFINKNADSTIEKKCILAEEIGHHLTASGNIAELDDVTKIKQENVGRQWGYNNLIPIEKIIDAVVCGCENLSMVAEYLDVTEKFLSEALLFFSRKYGHTLKMDGYVITFSNQSIVVHPSIA